MEENNSSKKKRDKDGRNRECISGVELNFERLPISPLFHIPLITQTNEIVTFFIDSINNILNLIEVYPVKK